MPESPESSMIVEAPLNYLREVPSEKPAFYIHVPIPENPRRGPQLGPRMMQIHDARPLRDELSLDVEGVILVDAPTTFSDFYDPDRVRTSYFPEIEALVKEKTGAVRVVAFDHNLRSKALASEKRYEAQMPVLFAHNDYTEDSGPQRVRDLFPDEAAELLEKRFAVINVWRPTRGPVRESPLAVCDAQTMGPNDLVAMDLIYPDRIGEVQSLRFEAEHRWLYFPEMQASEVMLLKCYDSAKDGRARFTAHTAFEDPNTPDDASNRESIEVRTLAFFGEVR
jgi:hypothetical protein